MTSTSGGHQVLLDEVEPTLSEVTFVIVDLETTGTSPGHNEITEIGAVRVRGGEIESEISTFVGIEQRLPRQITNLTGITESDLVGAPSLGEVMATFEEFCRGSVLVAHNARFDIGFLRAAAARTGRTWWSPPVLCTLSLARKVLHTGETRNFRLSELAAHLRSETEPCHRALADARATSDVLHALIARVGNSGVVTLSELKSYDNRLPSDVRRRSELTDSLPEGPGVYVFRDSGGGALYVGSSVNVRRRARSYYTGGDQRTRMRRMASLAESVEAVPCAHELEAWTVEDKLIDRLQPPYNRRSRTPRRGWWLSPPSTAAGRPRVAREPTADALGPFRRAVDAREAWAVAEEHIDGDTTHQRVERLSSGWAALVSGRESTLLRELTDAVERLGGLGAFERAARLRDRLRPLVDALIVQQELTTTATCPEIVLARWTPQRNWAVAVIRYGRLAGSGNVPRNAYPMPAIDAIIAGASTVSPGAGPLRGATPAQIRHVHRWIDGAPTRIVSCTGGWDMGTDGAWRFREWSATAAGAASEFRP